MITFQYTSKLSGTHMVKTLNNEDIGWVEAVEEFVQFLRGCGYIIAPGAYEEEADIVWPEAKAYDEDDTDE